MVCCCQIWGDILIPLISAVIGGALTFLGVYYTIKKQEKKENRNERLNYKPYLKISQNKCKNEICCYDVDKGCFFKSISGLAYGKYEFILKHMTKKGCGFRNR